MSNIILLELNEVPWRILDDYIVRHPNSALAKVNRTATRFETVAEDSDLSPWITWPSVHRGVSDNHHSISNFGQNLSEIDEAFPPIWKIIANNNHSVGVFGSLHTHPVPHDLTNYAFHVPDIFAAGSECFPHSIEPYQKWNLSMSRKSARNVSTKLPLLDTARFLSSVPSLGLRFNTAAEVTRHLIDERKANWKVVRRRTQQVLIAFDVFMKQLQLHKPAFTSFFTNHVASTMHRYWAASFPGDYDEFGYSNEWQTKHQHEIDWTLGKFDNMLNRLLNFTASNPEFEIWIASSMGQAATRADNVTETQLYIDDLNSFMAYFDIDESDYIQKPSMAPRIIVEFRDDNIANKFESTAVNLNFCDVHQNALAEGENTSLSIRNLGNKVFMIRVPVIQNHNGREISVNGAELDIAHLGIKNVAIADQSGQTAYHIPEGSLLIYSEHYSAEKSDAITANIQTANSNKESISTLSIAPMILNNFNISVPPYMTSK